jgi:hypothetical protein
MKYLSPILIVLLLSTSGWSYEIPDENEVITRTCSLSVKLDIIPDPGMKRRSGRAKVAVFLGDRDGNPHRGETLELRATIGTFICKLPDDTTGPKDEASTSCFTTGDDGYARLYLVNIPFNQQIRVNAKYGCGDYIVTGNASLVIRRAKARRKGKRRVRLPH